MAVTRSSGRSGTISAGGRSLRSLRRAQSTASRLTARRNQAVPAAVPCPERNDPVPVNQRHALHGREGPARNEDPADGLGRIGRRAGRRRVRRRVHRRRDPNRCPIRNSTWLTRTAQNTGPKLAPAADEPHSPPVILRSTGTAHNVECAAARHETALLTGHRPDARSGVPGRSPVRTGCGRSTTRPTIEKVR